MTDRLGQQLGSYRLVRLLGRGGFAEVYLAEHLRLNTQAAIKVLHTSLEGDDVQGFLREAQMVARLRHPHIVRVFDFDVENHTPFLVMDYLPNGNVRRLYPKGTPLPLPTIVSYVTQVASALQYAHDEKLIHRDIKPENMLLDRDNTLVLSDFGIALMSQSSRYQSTREVAGTAAYMAPEQFQGHPRRASDQYSLAVVVYEWLTGDRLFHGSFSEIASQHLFVPPPPLHEKLPTISPDVEQVVLTGLEKDPQKRFASVQAFATALDQACETAPPPQGTFSTKPASSSEIGAAVVPSEVSQAAHIGAPSSQFTPQQTPAEIQSRLSLPEHQRDTASTSRRPGLPRHWQALLLGLALLALAGSLLFNIIRTPQTTTNNTSTSNHIIATSPADATATAQAAAATAVTNATATAQAAATVSALQQIYTQATSGTPAISDPLSDDRSSWGVFTTSWGGQCAFTGGAYHLTLSKPGYVLFCNCANLANLSNFNNYALQLQLTIKRGDEGGVVFDQTANNAYRIDISSAGTFILYQHTPRLVILQNGSSPAIKTGLNQTNVLTVIIKNGGLYLYVNSQFVTSYYFGANSNGGGDLAAQSVNQPTDVAFSNLKIWRL